MIEPRKSFPRLTGDAVVSQSRQQHIGLVAGEVELLAAGADPVARARLDRPIGGGGALNTGALTQIGTEAAAYAGLAGSAPSL